jgi:hypothetical protein
MHRNVKKPTSGGKNKIRYKKNGVELLCNDWVPICHGSFYERKDEAILCQLLGMSKLRETPGVIQVMNNKER